MRERAGAGPAAERANAIRLMAGQHGGEDEANASPTIAVEPDADAVVRLAAAEVEVGQITAEPFEVALPAVIEILKHPDAALRLRAANVLGAPIRERSHPGRTSWPPSSGRNASPRSAGPWPWPSRAIAAPTAKSWSRSCSSCRPGSRRRTGRAIVSVRRSLWEGLESFAPIAPAEELAGWLVNRIEAPALVEELDPDRARAVIVLRTLDLPEWELIPRLARWLVEDPDPRVRVAAVRSPSVCARIPRQAAARGGHP